MNKKETRNLILEVFAGIILFTAMLMLAALFFYPKTSVFAGLLLGMVLAQSMFLSMTIVLVLLMKAKNRKIVQFGSIISAAIRYVIFFLLMIILITRFSRQVNPVAIVLGVFGLKFGMILQPFIHKSAAALIEKARK